MAGFSLIVLILLLIISIPVLFALMFFFGIVIISIAALFALMLFFGIGALVVGIGGLGFSSFMENSLSKSIMLTIFSIIFALGLLCVSPLVAIYVGTAEVLNALVAVSGVCVCVLGIRGFMVSRGVKNKIHRLALSIIFAVASAGGALFLLPLIITLF